MITPAVLAADEKTHVAEAAGRRRLGRRRRWCLAFRLFVRCGHDAVSVKREGTDTAGWAAAVERPPNQLH